ncbi:MAG: NAD(+) synthase [Firmicutes bacterium]|nr:NAD(+) synthase [Bacillota bacterium]
MNKYGKNFFINDDNAKEYIELIGDWMRGEVEAAGRSGLEIGMSGGIDCSVVARLAQEAGIPITLNMMPNGQSMDGEDMANSMEFIEKFNFEKYRTINIQGTVKNAQNEVEQALGKPLDKLSLENIPPRVRMTMLYALAQANRSFVIGTGNLNERLLGYFTKHGDGASDLNPLGMITKGEIYTLAKHLDMTKSIMEKPPSAGLSPGQTDEKDLGFPWSAVDKFIMNNTSGDEQIDKEIERRMTMSGHKLKVPPMFNGLKGIQNDATINYEK